MGIYVNESKNKNYSLAKARKLCEETRKLAEKYELPFFIVTEGASAYSNNGNPAVKNARECQIKWERENGFDPDEDWSKK